MVAHPNWISSKVNPSKDWPSETTSDYLCTKPKCRRLEDAILLDWYISNPSHPPSYSCHFSQLRCEHEAVCLRWDVFCLDGFWHFLSHFILSPENGLCHLSSPGGCYQLSAEPLTETPALLELQVSPVWANKSQSKKLDILLSGVSIGLWPFSSVHRGDRVRTWGESRRQVLVLAAVTPVADFLNLWASTFSWASSYSYLLQ